MTEAVSTAVLLADDILSFATCVIGAAFLGHVLLYHDEVLAETSGAGVFDAGAKVVGEVRDDLRCLTGESF